MINKLHGLSPSGLVSPSGGFASLFFDQVEYFASIKLCQALSRQGATIKIPVVRCHYLLCSSAQSTFTDIKRLLKTGETGKNRTDQDKILVAGGPSIGDVQPRTVYCTGGMVLDRKSRIQKWQIKKKNDWQKKKTSWIWANGREGRKKIKTEFVQAVYGTCCWTVTGRNGITETYYPSTPKKEVRSFYFRKIVAKKC